MTLDKRIADIFGLEPDGTIPNPEIPTSVQATPEAEPVVESEFGPEPEVDPDAIPEEPDPFAAMLDQMMAAEGVDVALEKRRIYNPAQGNLQEHDWESPRMTEYSDEKYKFRCKRCSKWVEVGREQTVAEALQELGIDPDCGKSVISGVMES